MKAKEVSSKMIFIAIFLVILVGVVTLIFNFYFKADYLSSSKSTQKNEKILMEVLGDHRICQVEKKLKVNLEEIEKGVHRVITSEDLNFKKGDILVGDPLKAPRGRINRVRGGMMENVPLGYEIALSCH